MTGKEPVGEILLSNEIALFDSSAEDYERTLDQLIDDDFIEIGSSGKIYTKKMTVGVLLQPGRRSIDPEFISLRELSENLYMLTFRTGSGSVTVVRNSIWKRTDSGWKIIYHQGTPVTG